MAGRMIFPVKAPGFGGKAPVTRKYKTGETFKAGALCIFDANGELVECSATPSIVDFIALENAGAKPGYDMANSPTVVTNRKQEVTGILINQDTVTQFSMRAVNGATDPLTPTQTMIDEEYGAAKDADGIWYLDQANVTQKVWKCIGIDIATKVFYCTPIATAVGL